MRIQILDPPGSGSSMRILICPDVSHTVMRIRSEPDPYYSKNVPLVFCALQIFFYISKILILV